MLPHCHRGDFQLLRQHACGLRALGLQEVENALTSASIAIDVFLVHGSILPDQSYFAMECLTYFRKIVLYKVSVPSERRISMFSEKELAYLKSQRLARLAT